MAKSVDKPNPMIETLPQAFARHRIEVDHEGNPIDYITLEVNSAFEKMTGLKRENISGRKMTEVLPGIENSEIDWIGIFGKVALDGTSFNFEQYFEPLSRWYSIQTYSDEKGYFSTVFNEITAARNETASIKTLLRLTEKLLELNGTAFNYQQPAETLRSLAGAKFASINTYEENHTKSVTRSVAGLPDLIDRASKALGFKIVDQSWDLNPERLRKMAGGKLVHFSGLYETAMGALSQKTASFLQNLAGIGSIYVIELTYAGQEAIGDIIFFMPKGKDIRNREAIELYAGQLGSLLTRLRSDRAYQQKSEELDRYFNNSLDLLCVANTNGEFIRVNKRWEEILGYSAAELEGRQFLDFVHPEDLASTLETMAALDEQVEVKSFKNRYLCSDGTYRWIEWRSKPVGEIIYAVARDVTELVEFEKNKEYHHNFEKMVARISSYFVTLSAGRFDEQINYALQTVGEFFDVDRSYVYRFSEDNETYSNTHLWQKPGVEGYFEKDQDFPVDLTPWWVSELKSGRPVNIPDVPAMPEKLALDRADFMSEGIISILTLPLVWEGKVFGCFGFDTVSGQRTWTAEQLELLQVVAELISGVLARHDADLKIRKLSFHDQLTGLYNRHYFENEVMRLDRSREHPISLISADLDGLKLINDTIGHAEGDRYLQAGANLLKNTLRGSDILARVGGDEFVILLPQTDRAAAEQLKHRIRSSIEEYNSGQSNLPLSISIGLAVSKSADCSVEETYKIADHDMYSNKLKHGQKARAGIVSSLLTSLFERGNITEGEHDQVQELAVRMGQALGMTEEQLANLALLGQVYDLGKVGYPDSLIHASICSNNGELTKAEKEAVYRHPETGYRIASSSPDLSHIADLILKHHENYDGSGYPLGLKGAKIPLECRILSIAIAYSAMTNPRAYADMLAHDAALTELNNCAGSQFDPELVQLFIEMLS